jgi:hypothetical protein
VYLLGLHFLIFTSTEGSNMDKRIIMETEKKSRLPTLTKVNESFTINRYDNGYMIEVSGKDIENDWKTHKLICTTRAELFEVITEALDLPKDD